MAAATYTIPFGPVVPVLATLTSVIILVGATGEQLGSGAAALLAGAALFLTVRSVSGSEPTRW